MGSTLPNFSFVSVFFSIVCSTGGTSVSSSIYLASPKSHSLMFNLPSNIMLSGFKSRCATSLELKNSIATRI